MRRSRRAVDPDTPEAALQAAAAALDAGHAPRAREIAQAVLRRAQGHDLHVEAQALASLARGGPKPTP